MTQKVISITTSRYITDATIQQINEAAADKNIDGIFFHSDSLLKCTIDILVSEPIVETQYIARAQGKGTSKFLGVYKRHNTWHAKIVHRHEKYSETFNSEESAARWYDMMAVKLRGPDAVVNFPKQLEKVAK